jgi:hypothetical protein
MFEGTPVASHLVIDDQIFVNARDKTDPGMEQIKKTIIQQAKHQPTWGQTLLSSIVIKATPLWTRAAISNSSGRKHFGKG